MQRLTLRSLLLLALYNSCAAQEDAVTDGAPAAPANAEAIEGGFEAVASTNGAVAGIAAAITSGIEQNQAATAAVAGSPDPTPVPDGDDDTVTDDAAEESPKKGLGKVLSKVSKIVFGETTGTAKHTFTQGAPPTTMTKDDKPLVISVGPSGLLVINSTSTTVGTGVFTNSLLGTGRTTVNSTQMVDRTSSTSSGESLHTTELPSSPPAGVAHPSGTTALSGSDKDTSAKPSGSTQHGGSGNAAGSGILPPSGTGGSAQPSGVVPPFPAGGTGAQGNAAPTGSPATTAGGNAATDVEEGSEPQPTMAGASQGFPAPAGGNHTIVSVTVVTVGGASGVPIVAGAAAQSVNVGGVPAQVSLGPSGELMVNGTLTTLPTQGTAVVGALGVLGAPAVVETDARVSSVEGGLTTIMGGLTTVVQEGTTVVQTSDGQLTTVTEAGTTVTADAAPEPTNELYLKNKALYDSLEEDVATTIVSRRHGLYLAQSIRGIGMTNMSSVFRQRIRQPSVSRSTLGHRSPKCSTCVAKAKKAIVPSSVSQVLFVPYDSNLLKWVSHETMLMTVNISSRCYLWEWRERR